MTKKVKKCIGYLLLCCIMLFLCGCSTAGSIATYTIVLDKLPKNLDPQIADKPEEITILTNIYDCLFDFYDGVPQLNIAKGYTVSQDRLSYDFEIKNDRKFYGYKKEIPITAKDFEFAFKRILDERTKSPFYDDFKNINTVTATDAYRLNITLHKPDGNFLDKLCLPASAPCNEEFFISTQGAYGLGVKNILSSGPFKVNYIADDASYITLVRMGDEKNSVDRIRISKKGDGESEKQLYENDKISGYFETSKAVNKPDSTLNYFTNSTVNLFFNLDKPEFQNGNIRKALAFYAYALENSGANLNAVRPSLSAFNNSITFNAIPINQQLEYIKPTYMNASAKEYMQIGLGELGLVKLPNLTVLIANDSPYSVVFENINQIWQKELAQFFNIQLITNDEIEERIAAKDFDIAFRQITPKVNSPTAILQNYEEYDNRIFEINKQAEKNMGTSQLLPLMNEAQAIVLNEAFCVPICENRLTYIHKNYFQNIIINPFGNILNIKYAKVK